MGKIIGRVVLLSAKSRGNSHTLRLRLKSEAEAETDLTVKDTRTFASGCNRPTLLHRESHQIGCRGVIPLVSGT